MAVDREAEGKKIVDEDRITDNGDGTYAIKGTDYANITADKCSCPDKTIRRTPVCKHNHAVRYYENKNKPQQTLIQDTKIIDYIKEKKKVSYDELKEKLGYSDEELFEKLNKLLQKGEIYSPKLDTYLIL